MIGWTKKHVGIISLAVATITLIVILVVEIPVWYRDSDGDGYGDPSTKKSWLWKPDGYVENNKDCFDRNQNAYPASEKFFSKERGDGNFDYNCDGKSKRSQTATGSCSSGKANQGWDGGVPECGKEGKWLVDCDRKIFTEKREHEIRKQKCR